MKKFVLICAFTFVAAIVYGQTELPKTREVAGFRPGMTIALHLDPATGEYVDSEELRRRRNGKPPHSANDVRGHRVRQQGEQNTLRVNGKSAHNTNNVRLHRVRYQGELNTLYVLGTGTKAYNIVGVETIHGVRINPYLFCGIGVGVNYYYKSTTRDYKYIGAKFIPVFVDLKYYFFDTKVSPYLKIDAGYGIDNGGRLYVSPSIGVKCSVASTMAINFDIGYQGQQINKYGSADMLDGVVFRLGWSF